MSEQTTIPLPQPGDIYYQKAIILSQEGNKQKLLRLHVSDEFGRIEGEISELRSVAIFEHNFHEQFAPTEETSVFIRSVQITSCDDEANEVEYIRLDKEGKRILPVSKHKEKLNTFIQTHFNPRAQTA